MKKQVRLDGLKGAMTLFAVALLQSSSAIAETEAIAPSTGTAWRGSMMWLYTLPSTSK